MNTFSIFAAPFGAGLRVGCIAGLVLATAWSNAQTSGRIKSAPQPVAPALPAPGTLGPGMPNPAGLAPPTSLPSPGVPAGNPALSDDPPLNTAVPQTNVMGAGAYGGGVATRPTAGMVAGPYTAVQVAQSFIGADLDRDGELTRAEAQRLTIVPYSIEEIDRNHDGIITRFEYDDAFR